jgi:hypothetical protein
MTKKCDSCVEAKATHVCTDCDMEFCEDCAHMLEMQCECIYYQNIVPKDKPKKKVLSKKRVSVKKKGAKK